jgi:hypothetical protein
MSIQAALHQFRVVSEGWENDRPGGSIVFDGMQLQRSDDSVSKNPYLVVQVDRELIHNHNDIDDPRILAFIRQLILLSSQHSDPAARLQQRALLPAE